MTALAARPAPKARDVAFAVIRDVFGPAKRGAAESLDYHLRKTPLEPRDRAFATELAYGTIEQRRWLDFQLEPYLGARAARLPSMIAEILRLGAYQLRALRVHPYAAVSESVALARRFGHPGTAGLVNAVLRRVAAEPAREVELATFASLDDGLGTRWSLPSWLVRSWRERFGDERIAAIAAGVNETARIGLAVDLQRTSRESLIAKLAAHDVAAAPSPFARDAIVLAGTVATGVLQAIVDADAELQSEAACMPVDLLDPQPGARLLDAACGRGNKLLQLGRAASEGASILAVDTDARKIAQARVRVEAAGLSGIELQAGDVRALPAEPRFDGALLDAPCSATGIVARQPEARWRKQPDDGARLAPLQASLLAAVAARVAPGGRLVYAVCSTDPRETEEVVAPFVADRTLVRLPLPERYAPFVTTAGDVLVPPGIDGRDGFFIALLERP
jgi:16S rRNA (cytosine967-C5)-methyltransferase